MTGKTKIILKILAAVVITLIYFYASCFAGNIIALIFLPLSSVFADGNDVLTWVLFFAPPVLLFTVIDNLLFDPLCRLFERPIWVYTVLSGNFMTLYGIFAMIDATVSSGERYSGFKELGSILLVIPVISLLGGTLFCLLVRLFKNRKAKRISDSESAKEYTK
ncbi:MAG: hypothetical protein NC395_10605 [Prevotella sp.]|nr:hypothetical protein [Prevotella sp.]